MATAQGSIDLDAEFKTLGEQLKAGQCAAALTGYDRLLATKGRDENQREWLRMNSLRGLRSVAGCYLRQDTDSACAAIKHFNTAAGSAATQLLKERAAKDARQLMALCGAATLVVVAPPEPPATIPTTHRGRPANDSKWALALTGASGALLVSGLVVYLSSSTTDASGALNQQDYGRGAQDAFKSAGGWLMIAGATLGAAAIALWVFDDDDSTSTHLGLGATGLSVHGAF